MARTVRHAQLETRAARNKLKPRGKPYYKTLDEGLHLGYRKNQGSGKWVMRVYVGNQTYEVEKIATADDLSDANGVDVLTFAQAQTQARKRRDERSKTAAGITGPFTVSAALDSYLTFLENHRKAANDARHGIEAFIRPALGEIEVAALTADKISNWHAGLAKLAPRLRTRVGAEQQYAKLGKDDESRRRRRVSANRALAVLRAALNRAWRDRHVASDAEWRRVQPFKGVDAARIRWLSIGEAKRLVNGSAPDFRRLVQAALQTGARYGELARLTVADFDADNGTVAIWVSKSGKPRHIVLTGEGEAFFKQVTAGRAGDELIFRKEDGAAWQKSHQFRPMNAAVERAQIKPAINFHGLRHTWASLSVMAGMPLLVVAKNLGHSDTKMVEKHYGHLCPDYVKQAIQETAPRFGFKPDRKVVGL